MLERDLNLESLLYSLEALANKYNVKYVQWPLNDEIFRNYSFENFKIICNKILKNLKIILVSTPQIVICKDEKEKLLNQFHNDPLTGGHCGQKKLLKKLQAGYYWKHMSKDVSTFVKNCELCKLNKVKIGNKEPMSITETPQKPFDLVIVDTVGPLPISNNGYKYILTIVCDLTKYLILIPLIDKSANSVAKALFENCILTFGPMKEIRTDMGTEYKNEVITELCKLLNIKHKTSTAYRPQTVGSVERSHRTLNEYIRTYINDQLEKWEEYIKYFNFCYNITTHSSFNDKYSPFELVFGRRQNLNEVIFKSKVDPIYNIENYVKELKFKLQKAHLDASNLLKISKFKNKKIYDQKQNPLEFKINDMILLKNEPYNKFKPIYSGPFKIIEIKESNIIINDLNNHPIKVHKDRVIKY